MIENSRCVNVNNEMREVLSGYNKLQSEIRLARVAAWSSARAGACSCS